MTVGEITINEIQQLYDDNKFLEAYKLTESLWKNGVNVEEMDCDELILGARLAMRLGNSKYWRWLLRVAKKRFPESPKVDYFYSHVDLKNDFYQELITRIPEVNDPSLMGSRLASRAIGWSTVRDFQVAEKLIEKAKEFNSDRAWIKTCEAHLLLMKDKWKEAEELARQVWADNPGMPFCASVLNSSMVLQGKLEESINFFISEKEHIQSFEVLMTMINQCFANAERLGDKFDFWLEKADEFIRLLPDYAPLADRFAKKTFKYMRAEYAFVKKDDKKLKLLSEGLSDNFFKKMQENCEQNPNGNEYILPIVPVFQKHNTCLTSSIASVLKGMNEDISEEVLEKELFFGGAIMTKARDWLQNNGFHTRHIQLDKDLIVTLLKNKIPIIMSSYNDSYSHATVIFGFNESTGVLLVHDPSKSRWSRYLLKEFLEFEAPVGPNGLVIVRDKELLGLIPEHKSEPITLKMKFWEIYEKEGVKEAAKLINRLNEKYPEYPVTKYLKASYFSQGEKHSEALPLFKELLEEFPKSREIRNLYLHALDKTGDKALYKSELLKIVEKTRDPGITFGSMWDYAPPTVISQYCDLINISSPLRHEAKSLLRKHIKLNPTAYELYHMLGDIYMALENYEEAVIPFRIASTLEITNSHYARALCNTYRLLNKEDKALEYMSLRRENFPDHKQAYSVYLDYVSILDDYGYPSEAAEALELTLNKYPEEASVISYIISYYIKLGEWEQALEYLKKLEQGKINYFESGYEYYRAKGDWRKAKEICENWMGNAPDNLWLKEQYIDLLAHEKGYDYSREILESWLKEHPENENYQMMQYRFLNKIQKSQLAQELIKERLEKNPDSEWDWLERVHNTLNDLETANEDEKVRLQNELKFIIPEVERTSGDCPVTFVVKARMLEEEGAFDKAAEFYLKAIEQDPDYSYPYANLWNCTKYLDEDRALEFQEASVNCMLRQVGFLYTARTILYKMAAQRDFYEAEKAFNEWREVRENDPELIDSFANILLDYGKGKYDAERAVELLKEGVRKFPSYSVLQESLIRAYQKTLQKEEMFNALENFCYKYPIDVYHNLQLADLYKERGEEEKADSLYKSVMDRCPLNTYAFSKYSNFLWNLDKRAECLDVLQSYLDFMPESINIREELLMRYFESGMDEAAVDCAEKGTEIYPDGSYLWYLYAKALRVSRFHQNMKDTLEAYGKALSLNPKLFDAAEDLVFLHCDHKDYAKALEVIESQINMQHDATPSIGLKAYILNQQGKTKDALELLKELLLSNPRYEWGWSLLFGILEEKIDDRLIEEVLKVWPVKNLLDLPDVSMKRLFLLHQAGVKNDELENEWLDLMDNYPDNADLFMRRFDILIEENRAEALSTLKKIMVHHPEDPFILARYLEFAFKESETEGLETAVKIWQKYNCSSNWPAGSAWEFIEKKKLEAKAYKLLSQNVKENKRLHSYIFSRFAEKFVEKNRQSLTKKVKELFKKLDEQNWSTSSEKESLFRALGNLKHDKLICDLAKKNPEFYENDTLVWQQYMSSLMAVDIKKAKAELSHWRVKPGVEMFIVKNYNLSIFRCMVSQNDKLSFREIQKNCLDALENLDHDWTVREIVSDLLEVTLDLGDIESFAKYYQMFINYMECSDPKVFYASPWCEFRYSMYKGFFYILTEGLHNRQTLKIMKKEIKKAFTLLHESDRSKYRRLYRKILKKAGIKYAFLTSWWATVKVY